MNIITLTTDFSTDDAYVGVMKGVILSIVPDASIVDITHTIPPQDIFKAAFVLKSAYRYFPKGTVHVVVVDPGVGTNRRRMAMKCGEWYFVGPDNGVFSYPIIHEGVNECVEMAVPSQDKRLRGRTFDGRDVFAPAAVKIASGARLADIGRPVTDLITLDIPRSSISKSMIDGQILYIDAFGNCVSNIEAGEVERLGGSVVVSVKDREFGELRAAYGEVEPGEPIALINSVDCVEIAVNGGNASSELGINIGDMVRVVRY